MKEKQSLSQEVQKYLSRNNMSKTKFAQEIGKSYRYIYDIIQGTKLPSKLLEERIRMFLKGEKIL